MIIIFQTVFLTFKKQYKELIISSIELPNNCQLKQYIDHFNEIHLRSKTFIYQKGAQGGVVLGSACGRK